MTTEIGLLRGVPVVPVREPVQLTAVGTDWNEIENPGLRISLRTGDVLVTAALVTECVKEAIAHSQRTFSEIAGGSDLTDMAPNAVVGRIRGIVGL